MGIIYSWLGYGVNTGRTDDPDPDTKLTSRDRYLVKSSWETVMKYPTGSGVKLFLRLFEIQPKYRQLFPFKNVPFEDLAQNKKFQAHCNSIIYSFASIVSGVDDGELLSHIAGNIGANHAKRSVDEQALKDVKQAMMDIFSFMTKEQLEAWSKTLDATFNQMSKVIKEKQSKI